MSEEICLRSYTTSLRRSDLVHANETGGLWGGGGATTGVLLNQTRVKERWRQKQGRNKTEKTLDTYEHAETTVSATYQSHALQPASL